MSRLALLASLLQFSAVQAADQFQPVGGSVRDIYFVPVPQQGNSFPNGHKANLRTVKWDGSEFSDPADSPVALNPKSNLVARNGRLPESGSVSVTSVTDRSKVGDCKILAEFIRDKTWVGRQPRKWITVDRRVVYKLDYVEWPFGTGEGEVHRSAEGTYGYKQYDYGLLNNERNGVLYAEDNKSGTGDLGDVCARLSYEMTAYGSRYLAWRDTGKYVQASGEVVHDIFIDIGSASAAIEVRGAWLALASISPCPDTGQLIENGVNPVKVRLGTEEASMSYQKAKTEQQPGDPNYSGNPPDPIPNPVVFADTVNGREKIGLIQVGVGFNDYGANPGRASGTILVIFNVQARQP